MRIPRLYVAADLTAGATITLDARAANHAARVLRLRTGAAVVLFDGQGAEFDAVLETVGKTQVTAQLQDRRAADREAPIQVGLVQGVARGERMDLTLQKSVELGVAALYPAWTARSQVKLTGDRLLTRMRHWEGVIISACEQSGRTRVPPLTPPRALDQTLETLPSAGLRLLLDPAGQCALHDLPAPREGVYLLVGPEGGLTTDERLLANRHGFTGVRLGPRILRTETAALVALAAIQTLWGDFR